MSGDNAAASPGRPAPHWILRMLTKFHPVLNKITGGRAFNTIGGTEVCFVTMTGAKTGKKRIVPLLYVPHGDSIILVASQTGRPTNPGWYANLVKHPKIQVLHRGKTRTLQAREAGTEEKATLWPICDAAYPDFIQYRARTARDIPLFVCDPIE